MSYFREAALEQINAKSITQTLGLLLSISFLPFFIHIQFISGPLVNALLIVILFLCGVRTAVLAAVIPSMMALAGGLLPVLLAPVIPFIMISNIIFIFVIDWFYKNTLDTGRGYWFGVVVGALLKFTFLFISVNFISRLLLKHELAAVVAQMMSWPQLATAILGGIIAWAFLKWLKFF